MTDRSSTRWRKRLSYQGYHFLAFMILGGLQYWVVQHVDLGVGHHWGLTSIEWVMLSWLFAGLFQAWVAFFWRMELYGDWVSETLGKRGFLIHQIGYGILGIIRFALLIPICLSTAKTLMLSPLLSASIIIITTPLILWALYSATVYFGYRRASGADHFDHAYRERAFEKKGLYRYAPNVMYSVVLLGLYHAGLFWLSTLGLVVAAAHHAFVWVHYYCTEKPDMQAIYGSST